jgi:hypothetical protein
MHCYISFEKISLKKHVDMTIGLDPGYIPRQTELIGLVKNYFFERFKDVIIKRCI